MSKSRHNAFTLVELLIVISVVALLAALLLPALRSARERAKVIICASNLHQLSISILSYAQDNTNWVPVACAYNGVYNDSEEYDFTVAGHHYVGNLTALFPDYLNTKLAWLCPSFRGKEMNDIGTYNFWYGWMERGGPLNPADYKRSSYLYTPWRNIAGPLTSSTGSGIYAQGSVRTEQSWTDGVRTISFNNTVIMSDNVADSTLIGGAEGCIGPGPTPFFASQHFDNHNLGGNAMHGDGSVEWVAMFTGRWAWAGWGYFNVSDN